MNGHSVRLGAYLALLLTSAALPAQAAPQAASIGLECRLIERSRIDCSNGACAKTDVKPFDETRWYTVDPAQHEIVQYTAEGNSLGRPFGQVVVQEDGLLGANGVQLGPGANSQSNLSFDLKTRKGGLSVLMQPGGEFSHGQDFNVWGPCVEKALEFIRSDKRSTR